MKMIILTGAGLSVASGLPVYRGDSGLWNSTSVEEYCDIDFFKKNRKNTEFFMNLLKFYDTLKSEVLKSKPNLGHELINSLKTKNTDLDLTLFTTNVDGLHEKSGFLDVVNLHGSLFGFVDLFRGREISIGDKLFSDAWEELRKTKEYEFSSYGLKPSVVFFGESAPNYKKLYSKIKYSALSSGDYIIMIGSSGSVISPESLIFSGKSGRKSKAKLIWINPDKYKNSDHFHNGEFAIFEKSYFLPAEEGIKAFARENGFLI